MTWWTTHSTSNLFEYLRRGFSLRVRVCTGLLAMRLCEIRTKIRATAAALSQPRGRPTRATCSVEFSRAAVTGSGRDAHVSNCRRRRWAVTKIPRWHTIVIAARECRWIRFDLEAVISSVGVHPRIFRSKTLQTIVAIILITDAHGFGMGAIRRDVNSRRRTVETCKRIYTAFAHFIWTIEITFFFIFFEFTVDVLIPLFVETRFKFYPDEDFTVRPSTDNFPFWLVCWPDRETFVNNMFPATVTKHWSSAGLKKPPRFYSPRKSVRETNHWFLACLRLNDVKNIPWANLFRIHSITDKNLLKTTLATDKR